MSEEQANWMEIYQSALLEFDPIKLPLRLQEARQAVEQRLQELKHDNANAHDGDGTQLQALADALQNLRVLSRTEAGGRDPYGGTHLASCLRIWAPVLLALFFIELVNQLLNQFVHLVLDPFPFGSVALDRANVHG
jgi:hypothetical protein